MSRTTNTLSVRRYRVLFPGYSHKTSPTIFECEKYIKSHIKTICKCPFVIVSVRGLLKPYPNLKILYRDKFFLDEIMTYFCKSCTQKSKSTVLCLVIHIPKEMKTSWCRLAGVYDDLECKDD